MLHRKNITCYETEYHRQVEILGSLYSMLVVRGDFGQAL